MDAVSDKQLCTEFAGNPDVKHKTKNELKLKKNYGLSLLNSNGFHNTAEIGCTIEEEVIANRCILVGHGFDDLLRQHSTNNSSSRAKFAKCPSNK